MSSSKFTPTAVIVVPVFNWSLNLHVGMCLGEFIGFAPFPLCPRGLLYV